MSAVIKLYVDTSNNFPIIPARLFVVENIADYLATRTGTNITVFNDVQYIKNGLELSINLDLSQQYSQPKDNKYCYVSVQNSGEKIYYYFIKNVNWRSKSCVQFNLVMDVLNTFELNTDYSFRKDTHIIREHKDRFFAKATKITIDAEQMVGPSKTVGYNHKLYDKNHSYISDVRVDVWDEVNDVYEFTMDGVTSLSTLRAALFQASGAVVDKIYIGSGEFECEISYGAINATIFYSLARMIDNVAENINPVLINNNTPVYIQKSAPFNTDWYLLYRNQNDPSDSLLNPVQCFLIPHVALPVNSGAIVAGRLTATSLDYDRYYTIYLNAYSPLDIRQSLTITLDNGTVINSNVGSDASKARVVLIKRNLDNTITVSAQSGYYTTNSGNTFEGSWTCNYLTFGTLPFNLFYSATPFIGSVDSMYVQWDNYETFDNTSLDSFLSAISELDRTDAKNIKLIKLPYIPYSFTSSVGKIQLDANWSYTEITQADSSSFYALKMNNMGTKLSATFSDTNVKPFDIFAPSALQNISTPPIVDRAHLDSKIYNSEFYRPKVIYDSFSFSMALETLDYTQYYSNPALTINFVVTSTINSKMLALFTNYDCSYALEDYNNVMNIARNNEEVLYNVPYINYIRNGFNYDVKSKELSATSTWASVGAGALGVVTSLLLPSAPLKIAGIIGSVVSSAISIKNAVVSSIQNEQSLREKLDQARNQASSVAGSDDVDLMSAYALNRFKYYVYTCTPLITSLIDDLFYYTGYNSQRIATPAVNTRYWFNYLECDASLNGVGDIPSDIVEELKNCYKNGVTILHKRSSTWDFNQDKENWETSLMGV